MIEIPLRKNSQRIDASWFNTIRAAFLNLVSDVNAQFGSLQSDLELDLNNQFDTLAASISTDIENSKFKKIPMAYTEVQTAASTVTLTLATLNAKQYFEHFLVYHPTAFKGGALSDVQVSIGITGDLERYCSKKSLFAVQTGTDFLIAQGLFVENFLASTDIKITFYSTGANLSALTQGAIEIYYKRGTLP